MQFLTKPVVKWMDDKKITPIREIFHTDREQAVELIKKLRKAQYVGFFGKYLHGYVQQVEEFGIKDLKKAIKAYNEALISGDTITYFNLALAYRELGDIKNEIECYKNGFFWSVPDTMHNYGCCYYYGYGVEKSLTMAHYAFTLSEREESKELLKTIDLGQDYILPTKEEKTIGEDYLKLDLQTLVNMHSTVDNKRVYYRYLGQKYFNENKYQSAFDSWMKAIELKDVESMYLITQYYAKRFVPQYAQRSTFESYYYNHINYWLERAVSFKHTKSIMKLASRTTNLEKAVSLYDMLASEGDLDAVEKIGLLYLNSAIGNYYTKGIKSHYNRAAYYFKKLIDNNDLRGYQHLSKLYLSKDYDEYSVDKAMEYLTIAADNNDAECNMILADYYVKGYYVEKNLQLAKKYFEKAFELGNLYKPDSMFGGMTIDPRYNEYIKILGQEAKELFANKRYEESFKLHQKCAKLNRQYNRDLAQYYLQGLYVEQNISQAIKLLSSVADKESNLLIGDIYFNGNGIEIDYQTAFKYYSKAYRNMFNIDAIIIVDNPVEKEAVYKCGYMYFHGLGVEKNIKEAVKYFKGAADKNHIGCKYYLGLIHSTDEYGLYNKDLAIKYLTEAANAENVEAMSLVGKYLLEGKLFEKNVSEAYKYFEKTAKLNDPYAQYAIGLAHYKGILGYAKDYTKAFEYSKLAADQGIVPAIKLVAVLYFEGIGTKQDKLMAQHYYKLLTKESDLSSKLMTNSTLYRNNESTSNKK